MHAPLTIVLALSVPALVVAADVAETPRATDLLRAKRLADQSAKKLALPKPKPARWRKGGGGFGAEREAPPQESVTVHVKPPKRAAKKRPDRG